jgi:predicted RNA-binding protein with PUA domain
MLEESMAGNLITISDRDPEAAVGGEGHPHDGGQLLVDEVMSATGIKQGDEVMILDAKSDVHGVAGGNPCDSQNRNFGLREIR